LDYKGRDRAGIARRRSFLLRWNIDEGESAVLGPADSISRWYGLPAIDAKKINDASNPERTKLVVTSPVGRVAVNQYAALKPE